MTTQMMEEKRELISMGETIFMGERIVTTIIIIIPTRIK